MTIDYAAWLRRSDRTPVALVEIDYVKEVAGAAVTSTLYFSTRPYVSGAADTPANQPYTDCIRKVPTFTRSLDRARLGGIYSVSFGSIEIANADGSQDAILGYAFDGSEVRVYYGDVSWSRADIATYGWIFSCVGASVAVPDPKTILFNVKDRSFLLDRNVGGNPMGGTGPNAGKPLPINFGFVHNVEALLEDQATNAYRYNDPRTNVLLLGKRDNGDAIPGGLADGNGSFVMASSPTGKITIDALAYTGYGFRTSGMYDSLLNLFAPSVVTGPVTPHSTFVEGSDYDYPLGISIKESRNLVDVLIDVANSSNTFFGFTRFGRFTYGRIFPYNPTSAPVLELVEDDVKPANAIKVEELIPLYDRIFCTGNKNWTVQDADSLAGTLTQDAKATYTREGYAYYEPVPSGTSYASNPALYHKTMGSSPVLATLISYWSTSSAGDPDVSPYLATFAEQYRKMFLSWLQLIDVTVGLRAYTLELGDIVRFTLPRFGLDDGPVMQVTSIAIDLNDESVGLTLAHRRTAGGLTPETWLMEDGVTPILMEDDETIEYVA